MDAQKTRHALVRVHGSDDFRTVATFTDAEEAAFVIGVLNDCCRARTYMLRPTLIPQRRTHDVAKT